MIGALLNATGILIGGLAGLWAKEGLSAHRQRQAQVLLGAFTIYAGFSMAWGGLRGSTNQFLSGLTVVFLALAIGKLLGHKLGIQRRINRVGKFASDRLNEAQSVQNQSFGAGFLACAGVYCLAPLALVGSIQEGLHGDLRPLAAKTVMDGLAAVAFVRAFGSGVLLSALPVLVLQGTITLLVRWILPTLERHLLVGVLSATAGFLVISVALVILRLRRIELADYWPSLILAPLLALLWR